MSHLSHPSLSIRICEIGIVELKGKNVCNILGNSTLLDTFKLQLLLSQTTKPQPGRHLEPGRKLHPRVRGSQRFRGRMEKPDLTYSSGVKPGQDTWHHKQVEIGRILSPSRLVVFKVLFSK